MFGSNFGIKKNEIKARKVEEVAEKIIKIGGALGFASMLGTAHVPKKINNNELFFNKENKVEQSFDSHTSRQKANEKDSLLMLDGKAIIEHGNYAGFSMEDLKEFESGGEMTEKEFTVNLMAIKEDKENELPEEKVTESKENEDDKIDNQEKLNIPPLEGKRKDEDIGFDEAYSDMNSLLTEIEKGIVLPNVLLHPIEYKKREIIQKKITIIVTELNSYLKSPEFLSDQETYKKMLEKVMVDTKEIEKTGNIKKPIIMFVYHLYVSGKLNSLEDLGILNMFLKDKDKLSYKIKTNIEDYYKNDPNLAHMDLEMLKKFHPGIANTIEEIKILGTFFAIYDQTDGLLATLSKMKPKEGKLVFPKETASLFKPIIMKNPNIIQKLEEIGEKYFW